MHDQRKFIDGILNFSPKKEKWIDKSVEDLPKKVAVDFETGVSGILDMDNPRAVVWAQLFDLQQRNKKPVYVEIDPETQIITRVLIPETSRVMSLEAMDNEDVDVVLFRAQARHYLNRGHPKFQEMLDALTNAKDNDLEVLITATRYHHEIIDVRQPPKEPGVEEPNPLPPPPPDPPVLPERAQDLFDLMNSKSCDACSADCYAIPHCIPFKHADDGCYARAHEMCRLMMDEGETPQKVWIYGGLRVETSNVHQCVINWGWHVAPTLMVIQPSGPDVMHVIDPSLCTAPVTVEDWKALQDDPGATLRYSGWEPFWSDWYLVDEGDWESHGIIDPDFFQTNTYLEQKCRYLVDDCDLFGPPPYVCPIEKRCHFIVDRSMFSESEVDAMLHDSSPAEMTAAFYIVLDGFTPFELGITSDSLTGEPDVKPVLSISPELDQITVIADALDVEDQTHLRRRQRLTWTYRISFSGTDDFDFPGDIETVTLTATISDETCSANIYLIKQPNPYEVDGAISWLSTDLRVFKINQGDSIFDVNMDTDPLAFIAQVITHLNNNTTGGETFEDDLPVEQNESILELSQTVDETAVYNFAIAKVRYRSLVASATDVRVFFRLVPWATASVAYDQSACYRRHDSGSNIIPLLGLNEGQLTSIPCFATLRVDSATTSLTEQTDPPNIQTIPADGSGAEVVQYFGCWLDINQPFQEQFPTEPDPPNGPFAAGRLSIRDHIRHQHQCLVSEIAFDPAPIQDGLTPATSDKLAQRNLSIVESENPGLIASRRIPQTFEIIPSASKEENDELMIDWGDVPLGSVATLYLPGFNTNDIISLAVKKYRTLQLVRIDDHTLKFDTGGMTYIPIPKSHGAFPGMLTVDLPEGVQKGQIFKIFVRQVTSEQRPIHTAHRAEISKCGWRRIVGSFQVTIPVHDKIEMLPAQERLLSMLRWTERVIPKGDRWYAVFGRYVKQIAQRVDALGGDSNKVAPSPSGQWKEAYRNCLLFKYAAILLIALLAVDIGVFTGGLLAGTGISILALLSVTVYLWNKKCRPRRCQLLLSLLSGTVLGAIVLALLVLFNVSAPILIITLIACGCIALITAIVCLIGRCFWC